MWRRLSKKQRRSLLVLTALLVIVLGLYIVAPLAARPMLRSRLQRMVSSQLNAELAIDSLSYQFPYGLTVTNASLTSIGPDGKPVRLLDLPRMQITLARHPFHSGPLVISKLVLNDPAVRMLRTADGFVGARELVKAEVLPAEWQSAFRPSAAPPEMRLSEMFELRLCQIINARIVYEDRRQAGTVPQVWRGLDARLDTTPATSPLYHFKFTAANAPHGNLSASGSMDIDTLDLDAREFQMNVHVDPGQAESPAPPNVQKLVRDMQIDGWLDLHGAAHMPLRAIGKSRFDMTLALKEARAKFPQWPQPLNRLDFNLRVASQAINRSTARSLPTSLPTRNPALFAILSDFRAVSGGDSLKVGHASGYLEYPTLIWTLSQTELEFRLGQPIAPTTVPSTAPSAVSKPVAITRPAADAPVVLNPVPMLQGVVTITASGAGRFKSDSDKPAAEPRNRLNLSLRSDGLAVSFHKLLLGNLSARARLTENEFALLDSGDDHPGFQANFYGGSIFGGGRAEWKGTPQYELKASMIKVDLKSLADAYALPGEKPKDISGKASARVEVIGLAKSSQTLSDQMHGKGEFRVMEAHFFELTAFKNMLQMTGVGNGGATVGQAAGVFTLENSKVKFQKLGLSSSVLGLQGMGDIYFDGKLDLRFIAASLSDWKKQLQKTKIPIVDDVGAELVGGIQNLLNSATGKLLYQFHVTGVVGQPNVTAEPAPLLTEGTLKIFSKMLKGGEDLLEEFKK